jgi:predicted O-linked N-acetylglucosamine transferase (SPINDLY family)
MLQGHRVGEAQAVCIKALEKWPVSADFYLILAQAQAENGETDQAVASYRSALELENDLAEAYRGLGAILFARQHYAEVITLCNEMIRARPDYHAAHADLGTALQACGRMDEAMVAYEQAVALNPQNLDARSNWLFCSNYTDGIAPQVIYEHAVAFSQYAGAHASPFAQWRCTNTPTRLRVGLVSGDLRDHPVGYFLENVIANTDEARVEWLAYSTVAQSDELTARLQTHVTKWTMLAGMSYEDSARCIHADGVHILIDLSGHTDKNILPVFTWRPAPIQVSWLGYFATTGLAEMDYFVADPVSVPVTEQRYFSEKIWSIADTRLCFSPPENAPDVAPPPSLANGYVTFGSFQKIPKITDVTLSLWAQILSTCPTACLRIQSGGLEDEVTRQALVERARLAGIEAGRLQLHQSESRSRYLATHSEVDILLDTFPFTGGTTTCEALWMGVPTVTLAGKNLVSRQGASLLGAAGLSDWVTESSQQYIDTAVQKASDTQALGSLRGGLRRQVQASPLYNAKLFSERFAEALWGMWDSRG